MKFLIATLVAPLASIPVIAPILIVMHGSLDAAGPLIFLCVVYGYPVQFILGMPLYLLARKKNWLKWWHCACFGALSGAALPMAMLALAPVVTGVAAFGSAMGAISGFAFWLIALCGSNNSFKPTPQSGAA
jgi:hypothetical protein